MKFFGTKRAVLRKSQGPAPTWPFGRDGNLVINSGTYQIIAGNTYDFNNVTISGSHVLQVMGAVGLGLDVNSGYLPTIIGIKGNLTIEAGSFISCEENALKIDDFENDLDLHPFTYSLDAPAGAQVNPVTYSIFQRAGGGGGNSQLANGGQEPDIYTGHGAGGAASSDGGPTVVDGLWGISGRGADGNVPNAEGGQPLDPSTDGFSRDGNLGGDGEGDVDSTIVSGGGGGALKGLHGGCLYIEVHGTVTVSGVCIQAAGSNGARGGQGGVATSSGIGDAFGGGGGGGSSGGSGGKVIIRYKLGSITSANVNVTAGTGGPGGDGGQAVAIDTGNAIPGQNGSAGQNGTAGSVDIATF